MSIHQIIRVCRDYLVGDEDPVFHHPLSSYGINGQAVLDGNDSLWITSAPQGDFPGRMGLTRFEYDEDRLVLH